MERAAKLPVVEGGKLIVVHVLPDGIPSKYRGQINREAQRSLEEVAGRVSNRYRKAGRADVSVVTVLQTGTAYVEIIRLARTEMADVIVLGKHGRRVIRDLLLGSTAEKVIRAANIPALIVKLKPSGSYCRPVIAIHLEDTARSTIELSLRLLGPKVRDISVLHAYAAPLEGFITPSFSSRELNAYRRECRVEALSKLHPSQAGRRHGSLGDRCQARGPKIFARSGKRRTSRGSDGAWHARPFGAFTCVAWQRGGIRRSFTRM